MVKVIKEGVKLDDGTLVSYRLIANNSEKREEVIRALNSCPVTYVPAQKLLGRIERFQRMLNGISHILWTPLMGKDIQYRFDHLNGLQKFENSDWVKSQRQLHEFLMHDNTKEITL